MTSEIDTDFLKYTYTFDKYQALIEKLLSENKTTGDNQSSAMVEYTKLNLFRTRRVSKTLKISEEMEQQISQVRSDMLWVVIAEAWCGDVSQNLPYFHRISSMTDKISLRIILRDKHPEFMDLFLTNGTRSIPKLICFDPETLEIVGIWGPRPVETQEYVQELKRDGAISGEKLKESIQRWYLADKGKALQKELSSIILEWDNQILNQKPLLVE